MKLIPKQSCNRTKKTYYIHMNKGLNKLTKKSYFVESEKIILKNGGAQGKIHDDENYFIEMTKSGQSRSRQVNQ